MYFINYYVQVTIYLMKIYSIFNKRRICLIFFLLITLVSCKKEEEVETEGNIEVNVRQVNKVCSIEYNEIKIGLFPAENFNNESFFDFEAIYFQNINNEGKVIFRDLPPDIYVVAVLGQYCTAKKYAKATAGATNKVAIID